MLCLVMVRRRTHHFLLSLSRNLHKPLLTLLLGIYNFGNIPFTFVLFNETQLHAPTCFFYPYSEKFQTPISFLLCQTCKVTGRMNQNSKIFWNWSLKCNFPATYFSPCMVSRKTSLKCQKFHFFYPVFTFPACSQIFLRFYNQKFSLYGHTFCFIIIIQLSWNFLEVSKISFHFRVSSHFLWDCIMPVLHMKLIWQLFSPRKCKIRETYLQLCMLLSFEFEGRNLVILFQIYWMDKGASNFHDVFQIKIFILFWFIFNLKTADFLLLTRRSDPKFFVTLFYSRLYLIVCLHQVFS